VVGNCKSSSSFTSSFGFATGAYFAGGPVGLPFGYRTGFSIFFSCT
jgi:hypothetical protein